MAEKKEMVIHPSFQPLFEDYIEQPRYYQVYGGRGSGKSYTASIAIIHLSYSEFGHKILYLRQTMTSAEDSTIADVRTAIKDLGVDKDFTESKGVIINKVTGSTITFKGIRASGGNTAKLKSLSGITTLVVEESEEIEDFDEFSKIDESIRIKGKPLKIILLYNPTSALSSWIHEEWFVDGQPNEERLKDTVFMHSTYLDNIDNLNPSVVQRYKDLELTNPTYYVNTILAEWTLEVSDRIYAGWTQYPTFEEDDSSCDVWYGLDFGYGGKDKTSCIKIKYFEGVYYVEEMFSQAQLTIHTTLSKMRQAGIPFNALIYADSAMPLLINEIRSGGYTMIRNAKKGNVEAGIKLVQNKQITLVGDNKSGLYFAYNTFRRNKVGKLPHEPDELAALRYGINSRVPLENPQIRRKRPIRRRGGFL